MLASSIALPTTLYSESCSFCWLSQTMDCAAAMGSVQQQHPFRVRTITAFLEMPVDPGLWEQEVASAGMFLETAKAYLEALGYEVQTTRIATQPFPKWLNCQIPCEGNGSSSSSNSAFTSQSQQEQQQQPDSNTPDAHATDTIQQLVANAVHFEALAAKHGIRLISIGSSRDAAHLRAIPQLITATSNTSCTFALPEEADADLVQQVATTVMQIAAQTGGMGNFRFAASCNISPGIPFFPVAAAAPGLHRTFALATESDALLHAAFTAAAAAAAAQDTSSSSSSTPHNVLAMAAGHLAHLLQKHWQPLEAAALHIEAAAAAAATQTASTPVTSTAPLQNGSSSDGMHRPTAAFRYSGLDSSLAPGLDTPALTAAYEQLGFCSRFGCAGSLTVSALITKVLKDLPLRLTGYCGLMLAVCEDEGLAAAAAAGTITISQLLQYSAVCGCGLDTVPVPGPLLMSQDSSSSALEQQQQQQEGLLAPNSSTDIAAAAAADARTTSSIAALLSDVNTMAYRLNKPLACRLLPLPGKVPGQPTGFDHPYMVNSRVMDLDK